MKTPNIEYHNLFEAMNYYSTHGFEFISTPWVVPENIINITLPKDSKPTHLTNNYKFENLVGSAEQGFLYLVINNGLSGKFQSMTPCFRDDAEDDWHFKYFFKLELFQNFQVNEERLNDLILVAKSFFERNLEVEVIKTSDNNCNLSYDIIDTKHGIELGSYGIREHVNTGLWIYGTGCAEPRLSQVIKNARSS